MIIVHGIDLAQIVSLVCVIFEGVEEFLDSNETGLSSLFLGAGVRERQATRGNLGKDLPERGSLQRRHD